MKKKKQVLKLSRETLRILSGPGLSHAYGGATLGCATASICSECETIVSCEPTNLSACC